MIPGCGCFFHARVFRFSSCFSQPTASWHRAGFELHRTASSWQLGNCIVGFSITQPAAERTSQNQPEQPTTKQWSPGWHPALLESPQQIHFSTRFSLVWSNDAALVPAPCGGCLPSSHKTCRDPIGDKLSGLGKSLAGAREIDKGGDATVIVEQGQRNRVHHLTTAWLGCAMSRPVGGIGPPSTFAHRHGTHAVPVACCTADTADRYRQQTAATGSNGCHPAPRGVSV